jgi:hypothetical protein
MRVARASEHHPITCTVVRLYGPSGSNSAPAPCQIWFSASLGWWRRSLLQRWCLPRFPRASVHSPSRSTHTPLPSQGDGSKSSAWADERDWASGYGRVSVFNSSNYTRHHPTFERYMSGEVRRFGHENVHVRVAALRATARVHPRPDGGKPTERSCSLATDGGPSNVRGWQGWGSGGDEGDERYAGILFGAGREIAAC